MVPGAGISGIPSSSISPRFFLQPKLRRSRVRRLFPFAQCPLSESPFLPRFPPPPLSCNSQYPPFCTLNAIDTPLHDVLWAFFLRHPVLFLFRRSLREVNSVLRRCSPFTRRNIYMNPRARMFSSFLSIAFFEACLSTLRGPRFPA